MSAVTLRTLRCESCGATLTGVSAWRPVVCEYCGSPAMAETAAAENVLSAQPTCLAFRIGAASATERLRQWLRSSFWAPKDLSTAARTEEQTGIYMPAWRAAADAQTDYTGVKIRSHERAVSRTVQDAQTGQPVTRTETVTDRYEEPVAGQREEGATSSSSRPRASSRRRSWR